MIYRLIFNRASNIKKKHILDSKGANIGCFMREDRKVYVYLLDNFFVEARHVNDDLEGPIEFAKSFTNYRRLEKYMEESLKQSNN